MYGAYPSTTAVATVLFQAVSPIVPSGFHFDWTINVSGILTGLAILFALVKYGSAVVNHLRTVSWRVNVMWGQFQRDHPDVAQAIEPPATWGQRRR